jgi:hypothetical protein
MDKKELEKMKDIVDTEAILDKAYCEDNGTINSLSDMLLKCAESGGRLSFIISGKYPGVYVVQRIVDKSVLDKEKLRAGSAEVDHTQKEDAVFEEENPAVEG